ncbi:MAG: polysaccharide biosynthesis protein [Actinobacteria bacterium]|nr:polysaccharide biosynthesis protein [Actinomycetota bacterium]
MQSLRRFISGNRYIKLLLDFLSVFLGFFIGLALRFEFSLPGFQAAKLLLAMPLILLVFYLFNSFMGLYAGRWKYASFDELLNLSSGSFLATGVVFLGALLIPGARSYLPLSVSVMGGVLSLFDMAFVRLQYRLYGEMNLRRGTAKGKKVLLVGAGEAGEMVARDMLRHPEYGYQPVGFVDDNPAKRRLVLQGVPVVGGREDIPRLVDELGAEEIFVTIPSLSGERLREILSFCEKAGARTKILPGIVRTMAGEVGVSSVRDIQLEDLLGREPVETDLSSISSYVSNKVVLVTGAGGSIGSELSMQLAGLGPKLLILLDNDETSLYELEMRLVRAFTSCPFHPVVADIRDAERIRSVFARYRPQVVFHSAALKHVPMMEYHPAEAVKNNVMGTRVVADASLEHGAERFILISTDKAVHPVNVMGASKRIAELLVKRRQGRAGRDGTMFTAVRFGNVLGSRGSVVPTFQRQIEEGGPVLITHPEITRYFMTIEEAAQLVIQAGAFTRGGDVFILDMGEPVRIVDLAREMIRLSGKEGEIEIRTTGLRPGEKLREALTFEEEEMVRTPHPKIHKALHEPELPEDFGERVDALVEAALRDDEERVRALLAELVPSYEARVPRGRLWVEGGGERATGDGVTSKIFGRDAESG